MIGHNKAKEPCCLVRMVGLVVVVRVAMVVADAAYVEMPKMALGNSSTPLLFTGCTVVISAQMNPYSIQT